MKNQYIFDRDYVEDMSNTSGLYQFKLTDEDGSLYKIVLRGSGDKPYRSISNYLDPQMVRLDASSDEISDEKFIELIQSYFKGRNSYVYFYNFFTDSYFDLLDGITTRYELEEDWKRAYHSRGPRIELSKNQIEEMMKIWDEDEANGSTLEF